MFYVSCFMIHAVCMRMYKWSFITIVSIAVVAQCVLCRPKCVHFDRMLFRRWWVKIEWVKFSYLNWWVWYRLATIICRWRLLSQYSVALSSLKLNESRYCVRLYKNIHNFFLHILICYVRSSIKIRRSWNLFNIVDLRYSLFG